MQLTPSQTIGPFYWGTIVKAYHADLAPPGVAGERIEIALVLHDAEGAVVPDGLFEIWQANSHGRYQFITIKPGAYPWKNHHNAWRPAHIHFSLFGPAFATRLITQMYFPQDPLLAYDPIYNAVPAGARERLQAAFDMAGTRPEWALAYRFDIVLRGRNATPMEN